MKLGYFQSSPKLPSLRHLSKPSLISFSLTMVRGLTVSLSHQNPGSWKRGTSFGGQRTDSEWGREVGRNLPFCSMSVWYLSTLIFQFGKCGAINLR